MRLYARTGCTPSRWLQINIYRNEFQYLPMTLPDVYHTRERFLLMVSPVCRCVYGVFRAAVRPDNIVNKLLRIPFAWESLIKILQNMISSIFN